VAKKFANQNGGNAVRIVTTDGAHAALFYDPEEWAVGEAGHVLADKVEGKLCMASKRAQRCDKASTETFKVETPNERLLLHVCPDHGKSNGFLSSKILATRCLSEVTDAELQRLAELTNPYGHASELKDMCKRLGLDVANTMGDNLKTLQVELRKRPTAAAISSNNGQQTTPQQAAPQHRTQVAKPKV
jgi:hypothetical protein